MKATDKLVYYHTISTCNVDVFGVVQDIIWNENLCQNCALREVEGVLIERDRFCMETMNHMLDLSSQPNK
jgi:hypothetical protein